MAIYLKIDGLNGDATTPEFKNWFNLTSMGWNQAIIGGKIKPDSLMVSMIMTVGSALLMQSTAAGNILSQVEVDITNISKGEEIITQRIVMLDVRLTDYQIACDAGSTPGLSISFLFTSMQIFQLRAGGYEAAGYNYAQNKKF